MYKVYDDIKDMLCDELDQISKKKELTSSSLDVIDKSIDIIKDIATIKAMEESGYSNDYSNGYMPRYIYEGNSYGRGPQAERDSRGRYSTEYDNRDHGRSYDYSGDTREEMRRLMEKAKTDKERDAIRNALNNM